MRCICRANGNHLNLAQKTTFDKLKELAKIDHAEPIYISVNGEPHVMLVDEDARSKRLPVNSRASSIVSYSWPNIKTSPVYGDAAVIPRGEME